MNKKYFAVLIFFALLPLSFAKAEWMSVHGQKIRPTRVMLNSNQSVIGAVLSAPLTIDLGENSLKDIPTGSTLYFQKNSGPFDELKVAGLIINKKMSDQRWILKNQMELRLNCGRYGGSPAFIELTKEFDLLSGCKSAADQTMGALRLTQKSNLTFFPNGKLKGSTLTSGTLNINGQIIKLAENLSLRFHDNGKLFYFHPAAGERFKLPTSLGEETIFHQPDSETLFATLFHPNGNLSTAILAPTQSDLSLKISMFGTDITLPIKDGHIGFDEQGRIDRVPLKETLHIEATSLTYIKSTETTFQITSYGIIKPGMSFSIKSHEQLFLDYKNGERRLRSFTEAGSNGLRYFNVLSDKPFKK
jgi:hypothetical protein